MSRQSVAAMQARLDAGAFNRLLGLQVIAADYDKQEIQVQVPLQPALERVPGSGQFHGGVIASVIDTVGVYALMMADGVPPSTVNFRVDYLRPAVDTTLHVLGKVLKQGKTISLVDVTVSNDQGKALAVGRLNYATVR